MATFESLPADLLNMIIDELEPRNIPRLAQVSKFMNAYVTRKYVRTKGPIVKFDCTPYKNPWANLRFAYYNVIVARAFSVVIDGRVLANRVKNSPLPNLSDRGLQKNDVIFVCANDFAGVRNLQLANTVVNGSELLKGVHTIHLNNNVTFVEAGLAIPDAQYFNEGPPNVAKIPHHDRCVVHSNVTWRMISRERHYARLVNEMYVTNLAIVDASEFANNKLMDLERCYVVNLANARMANNVNIRSSVYSIDRGFPPHINRLNLVNCEFARPLANCITLRILRIADQETNIRLGPLPHLDHVILKGNPRCNVVLDGPFPSTDVLFIENVSYNEDRFCVPEAKTVWMRGSNFIYFNDMRKLKYLSVMNGFPRMDCVIRRSPGIRYIWVESAAFDAPDLPNLDYLMLLGSKDDVIGGYPRLRTLKLLETDTGDIIDCPSLTFLDAYQCHGLKYLSLPPALQRISIHGCDTASIKITGDLRYLNLVGLEDRFRHIDCKTRIKTAVLTTMHIESIDLRVTDYLRVSNCAVLRSIRVLPEIQRVSISNCESLENIDALVNVPHLSIIGCNSITRIPELIGVQEFHLKNCKRVCDVSGMRNVPTVVLVYCRQVTNVNMLGGVQHLTLQYCFGLTDLRMIEGLCAVPFLTPPYETLKYIVANSPGDDM